MTSFRISEGRCHALYAFEVGLEVHLGQAGRQMGSGEPQQAPRKGASGADPVQYRPAPLRLEAESGTARIGSFAVEAALELVLYDFGAASVGYAIPLGPTDRDLLDLGRRLREDTALADDARRRIDDLVRSLGPSIERPRVAELVEDYFIFRVKGVEGVADAIDFAERHAATVAQVLRGESANLSPDEVADATAARISFARQDVTFVDWDSAFILDPEPGQFRHVLEFANVQLLELRYLDGQLDRLLERAYQLLFRRTGLRSLSPSFYASDLKELSTLQVESTILLERVTNAIKFLGEEYLARLYRLVAGRLHLQQWIESITRKLATIEGIYQKMTDRASTRRLELLEWVVILLIALEIVLGFVR
ncbi:MAG: hypothetical protein ACRENB_13450 [Gemmatimonadales bacterium]